MLCEKDAHLIVGRGEVGRVLEDALADAVQHLLDGQTGEEAVDDDHVAAASQPLRPEAIQQLPLRAQAVRQNVEPFPATMSLFFLVDRKQRRRERKRL